MNGRRTTFGLCIACALIVSAFAVQSASAATTAFTCAKTQTQKTWSDAHCKSEAGTKEFGHVTIAENTTTEVAIGAGTSKSTQRLKANLTGINTELIATSVSGAGSMHNATVNGEMQATGTGTKTYTQVTVVAPAGKGCKVRTDTDDTQKGEEGVIHTKEIKATTTNAMGVKFEPSAGTVFATFFMEGCEGSEALESLNRTYEVTGSVIGEPSGAEVVFTHTETTAQNTLKLNGHKAGLDGSTTYSAKESGQPEYKALTVTTPDAGGGYKEDS